MTRGDIFVRSQALDFKIPIGDLLRAFDKAPDRTFFHVRDAIGAIFGSFRRDWKGRTELKRANRFIFYRIEPRKKERGERKLEDIKAELFSTSEIALAHEEGATIRPKRRRFLAVPVEHALTAGGKPKRAFRTPARARAKGKDLFIIRHGNRFTLAIARGRGARRKLLPVFRLVRSITLPPRLHLMSTWDARSGDRDERLSRAMDRITKDIARGILS